MFVTLIVVVLGFVLSKKNSLEEEIPSKISLNAPHLSLVAPISLTMRIKNPESLHKLAQKLEIRIRRFVWVQFRDLMNVNYACIKPKPNLLNSGACWALCSHPDDIISQKNFECPATEICRIPIFSSIQICLSPSLRVRARYRSFTSERELPCRPRS